MIENNAPPRRRGRGWYVAALVAVLTGAFGVQASSTWLLADAHHVETYARPFLILMLEVGSITGAALYLATRDTVTRRSAGLLVIISSGVGGYGGISKYGVILGVACGAVLLLMVHTIGRFWHEPAPREEPPAMSEWDDPKPSWDDIGELRRADVTCKSCGRAMAVHEGQPLRCPTLTAPVDPDPATEPTPVPRREPLPAPAPEPEVEPLTARDEPAHADPRPPEPESAPDTTEPGLRAVPAPRTRKELEDAGRALPEDLRVTRRAGETKESLAQRVADAEEKARRRARTPA